MSAAYVDSYTGPVYTDGRRCGFVQNARITRRMRDAYLEHLTIEAGHGTWYLTRHAEEPPAPLEFEAGGHRHQVTAVSVARAINLAPRGGYEVGYYTGDRVTIRAQTPGLPDMYQVYRRFDGGDWHRATPEMTTAEHDMWNGKTGHHGAAAPIPALLAWLSEVPAPPIGLYLLPKESQR